MPVVTTSHPDRAAATLANLAASAVHGPAEFARPGPDAADCRIDLKLLQWRALAAAATCKASRAHLAAWNEETHPDLWAGTVQDGTARGFAVRLEEAIALAPPPPPSRAVSDLDNAKTTTGRDLRKRKDLLVASGGARVRFTRKEGLLFVDRNEELHSSNCLRFEARSDRGSLDQFVAAADERPRLYSAQFLQAQRYTEAAAARELVLAGRLGRGPLGWNCQVTITAWADEPTVHLTITIDNRLVGWRLRARFLGLPSDAITHDCTPVRDVVQNDAGGFVAFTLARAVGTLHVNGTPIATPAANCQGTLVHHFRLGTVHKGDAP